MIPSRLIGGRYVVLDERGSGVLGPLWRAQDKVTGKLVTVNEIRLPGAPGTAEVAGFRDRILREARLIGALADPGLLGVHDVLHVVVDGAGVDLLVTEFVPATRLSEHVAAGGRLSAEDGAALARSLLTTLDRAHRRGLVHGLVRPEAVLLADDGRIALTDVGLARAVAPLLGTGVLDEECTAPERVSPPTPAADLWALGTTLRRTVAAEPPLDDLLDDLLAEDPNARPSAEKALGRLGAGPEQRRWFRRR